MAERLAIVGSRPPGRGYSAAFKARWQTLVKGIVEPFVDQLPAGTVVVSGGATGVDSIAAKHAKLRGLEVNEILPNWKEYGKSAGYRRNVDIVKDADRVVAFWNSYSDGTAHTIDIARSAHKLSRIVRFSALECYTARIGCGDPDEYNIARKGGHLAFAPSWNLLAPYIEKRRAGLETEADWLEYCDRYLAEMRASFRDERNKDAWRDLLARERVVLACFCTHLAGEHPRCHRILLAERVLVPLGVTYHRELS